MAVTKIKTTSSFTNLTKYDSFLAGNAAYQPSSFESIASINGDGSSANILFTSIPQTYKHLQIRILGRTNVTGEGDATRYMFVQCNDDYPTTNVYSYHGLYGDGTSATAEAAPNYPTAGMYARGVSQSDSNPIMGALIADIHDYTSTSRYKTMRTFGGTDRNGAGDICLYSGLYQSTSAITKLRVSTNSGGWSTSTVVALYGIKGA